MNIFVLDRDPKLAAQYQCNKHVVKMITESAQMLANAYTLDRLAEKDVPRTQKGEPRKHSHLNHPCSKWVLKSKENWLWLLKHALWLCLEYNIRYNKSHFTYEFIKWCSNNHPDLPNNKLTEFVQAMPEEYKDEDVVIAYRLYYTQDKKDFARWSVRSVPLWWN